MAKKDPNDFTVEERLKAAQNFLKNQSKQQNYAWSESPAGA